MVLPMLFPVLYSCPVSLEHVLVYLVNYVVVLLSHCVLSIASCRIVVHEQDSTRSILFIGSFILSRLVMIWQSAGAASAFSLFYDVGVEVVLHILFNTT